MKIANYKNIHPPWSNDINFGVKLHFYNWISIGFVVPKENLDIFIALNRYKCTAFGISKWIASPLAYHSVHIFFLLFQQVACLGCACWCWRRDGPKFNLKLMFMRANSFERVMFINSRCSRFPLRVLKNVFKSKSMQKSTEIEGAQQKRICWLHSVRFCNDWLLNYWWTEREFSTNFPSKIAKKEDKRHSSVALTWCMPNNFLAKCLMECFRFQLAQEKSA